MMMMKIDFMENAKVQKILQVVMGHFKVSEIKIRGIGRTVDVAWPRQLIMYFIIEFGGTTILAGDTVSRDHSTALYAYDKVKGAIDTYPADRVLMEKLKKEIEA